MKLFMALHRAKFVHKGSPLEIIAANSSLLSAEHGRLHPRGETGRHCWPSH